LFLLRTLASTFFFFPPLHRMVSAYKVASEIAADRHAVEVMGSRRWLAAALAKTLGIPLAGPAFEGYADIRIAALVGDLPDEKVTNFQLWRLILAAETLIVGRLVSREDTSILANIWLHAVC
jgi:hypothetical protein